MKDSIKNEIYRACVDHRTATGREPNEITIGPDDYQRMIRSGDFNLKLVRTNPMTMSEEPDHAIHYIVLSGVTDIIPEYNEERVDAPTTTRIMELSTAKVRLGGVDIGDVRNVRISYNNEDKKYEKRLKD